jgi:hypothetical protein
MTRVARQYDAILRRSLLAFHDELTWRSIKPNLTRDSARVLRSRLRHGKMGLKLLKSGFARTTF